MAYTGGVVAASAAAEKRRRELLAEEEDMTEYTSGDLKSDWEFKIVRSDPGAFRKPEVLERLIEEEAQAGWVMLEKFDDNRVRFKRPRSARARDDFLPDGVDPYRTRYGSLSVQSATLVSVLLLVMSGLGAFLLLRGSGALAESTAFPSVIMPLVLVALGVFLVVWKVRRMS